MGTRNTDRSGEARGDRERSDLCLACGLCCQGASDLVPLDDDELDRAHRLHLPVVESPLRLAFSLPCPRLEDRRCTVYPERPRTCASYACETLRRVRRRRNRRETAALARVDTVRGLAARVSRPRGIGARRGGRRAQAGWVTWFDP